MFTLNILLAPKLLRRIKNGFFQARACSRKRPSSINLSFVFISLILSLLRYEGGENDRRVMSTKSKGIGKGNLNFMFLHFMGHRVDIT